MGGGELSEFHPLILEAFSVEIVGILQLVCPYKLELLQTQAIRSPFLGEMGRIIKELT